MEEENHVYSRSQLNFFRVCHLVTNVLPLVLRNVFVKQWNKKHAPLYGNWQNEAKNGKDFVGMESTRNKKRNGEILNDMANGDINQWDCTKLFYAILYSTSIGNSLDPDVRKHVDDLREFRNGSFAHVSQGHVTSSDFQKIVNKIVQAFCGLGEDTSEVKRIQNENTFSTEEIYELQEKLEQDLESQKQLDVRICSLEERVTILETKAEASRFTGNASDCCSSQHNAPPGNEIHSKFVSPFKVLPARPAHQVIQRTHAHVAQRLLADLKAIHENKVTALYILGGPGSGKSECARQLSKTVSRQISFVMTLEARKFDNFLISLKDFAVRLGFSDVALPYNQQASATSQLEFLSLFIKEKLASIPSWLLILDGLSEETRAILGYLPRPGDEGAGQVIITTQDGSVRVENCYASYLSLGNGLAQNESIQLLSAIVGSISPETARTISEKLGHQPMLLVSAANHVKKLSARTGKSADLTWKDIFENLKIRHKEHELPYFIAALNQTSRSNLESTIEMLMKRCEVYEELFHLIVLAKGAALPFSFVARMLSYQLRLSESEVELLLRNCLLCSFSTKGVLEFIGVNGVIYKLLCDILAPFVGKEEMVERLRCICDFARNSIHDPMVCGVFKILTSEILRYLSLLDLALPDHARRKNLHHELGKTFLSVLVDHSSAVLCFTKALSAFENAEDIDHREHARILRSFGNVLRLTGNLDEAYKYLTKSLKIFKSLCNDVLDEDIASCLSSQGLVYQSLGDLDRAGSLHHRALTIREQIHGEQDIKTATSMNNIGGVYHQRGDLTRAKEYYWKALEIKGRHYGWDVPHVANSFNNIAEISHEQGDLCSAVSIHKRALKIRQRLYGEDHPDIANSLNNIAVILHKLGELSSARKYHAKALEIRKTIYGKDHVEVASSLNNLGEVYYDEGDLAAAESCHMQALRIRQGNSMATSHVISSLHNLIRVYIADKEISTAKAYAYEVFRIFQQTYGMNDPRTVHAFRRVTELSKRESHGHACDISFDTFEHVERLSCL